MTRTRGRFQERYGPSSPTRYADYRDDSVGFIENILGDKLWGEEDSPTGHRGQRGIAADVVQYDENVIIASRGIGKTFLMARIAVWFLETRENSVVVTTAPTGHQVRNLLWRQIRQVYANAKLPLRGRCMTQEVELGPNWFGIGLSTNEPDRFAGFHGDGGLLFLVDEASGVSDEIYNSADGFTTQPGCKTVLITNPLRRSGRVWKVWQPGSGYRRTQVSAFDAPKHLVTEEWIEKRRKQYGPDPEEDPRWWYYVKGQFPPQGDDMLVPYHWLSVRATHHPDVSGRWMGLDVARQGSDRSVAVLIRDGRVAAMDVWRTPDLMETAARALRLARKWRVPSGNLGIDIGMGAGVIDRLKQLGFETTPVDFGSAPKYLRPNLYGSDTKFNLFRDELFWTVRVMVQEGLLSIPEVWEDTLWTELGAFGFDHDGRERITVSSKDKVKAALGYSPDCADALVCALARSSSSRSFLGSR